MSDTAAAAAAAAATPAAKPAVASDAAAEPAVASDAAATASASATSAAPNATTAKILRQVEFYFSDSNLPGDQFLSSLVARNEEGWVDIATIASFKRMRQLSQNLDEVVAALRESKEALVVNEAGTQVRRSQPVPQQVDLTPRTMYAKGFDVKIDGDAAIDTITEFFSKYGNVECVRLRNRRDRMRSFKGSAFITFDSPETAKKVRDMTIKLTDDAAEPLLLYMKAEHAEVQQARWAEQKAQRVAAGKDKGKKDDKKDGNNKKRKEPETPVDPEEAAAAAAATRAADEAAALEELDKTIVPDLVVSYEGLAEESSREHIRDVFQELGCTVVWVDFSRGQTDGKVRFAADSQTKASEAVAKFNDLGLTINDGTPSCVRALAGDEEKEYYAQVVWPRMAESKIRRAENKKTQQQQRGGGRRGGRGGGRGGRGGKRQRRD